MKGQMSSFKKVVEIRELFGGTFRMPAPFFAPTMILLACTAGFVYNAYKRKKGSYAAE